MAQVFNRETTMFYSSAVLIGVAFWWLMDWTVYELHSGGKNPIFVIPSSVQLGLSLAVGLE
jgi:hypothetical protein